MKRVELIYEIDCPNVAAARVALLRAFVLAGQMPRWTEWDRSARESPDYAGAYGSPSILVDGEDITGEAPSSRGRSCRLYAGAEGLAGVPPVERIAAALSRRRSDGTLGARRSRWRSLAGPLLGSGALLLPVGACPACWPAYAGFLSSLGVGFLLYDRYLLPLLVVLLSFSVGSLAYDASARRGYGPFLAGLGGGVLAVIGKFAFEDPLLLYVGFALLLVAGVWNSWPGRRAGATSCEMCAPRAAAKSSRAHPKEDPMAKKRFIEVFSAGCPVCEETIATVKRVACPSCEVAVLDMHDAAVAARAKSLGIRSVPAVVIDGKLADCCAGRGPDEAVLRAAGLGQAMP